DPDEDLGEQTGVGGHGAAGQGAGPARGGRVTGAGAAADAVRALEPDRGAHHALGADRPLATGAADAGLPVRVAIAGGQAVDFRRPLVRRALRTAWCLVHEGPLVRPGRCTAAAPSGKAPP